MPVTAEPATKPDRERLLQHVWALVDWWERESRVPDARGKLSGLAFSILSTLDGCSPEVPPMAVRPIGEDSSEGEDIGGGLHEHFHQYDPRKH